jgi:hypothetical protein
MTNTQHTSPPASGRARLGWVLGLTSARHPDADRAQYLVRLLAHAIAIDDAEAGQAVRFLAAEENVVRHRHRVDQGQILVEGFDARDPCVPGRLQGLGLPVDQHGAFVGHLDPDRILISVDLPAPLSPTMPVRPGLNSTEMTSRAVTCPYCLARPVAGSRGGADGSARVTGPLPPRAAPFSCRIVRSRVR